MEALFEDTLANQTPCQADSEVMLRIRNMLKRGLHPTTPEAEAAQAMRLATRMLEKHNLSQLQVMREEGETIGAMFRVHIRYCASKLPAVTKPWTNGLTRLCALHFQCQAYMVSRKAHGLKDAKCFYCFYGMTANAYSAAVAFASCFNRISDLARLHKVPSGEYESKRHSIACSKAHYTLSAKVSYCNGLVHGLEQRVKEMAEKEESSMSQAEEKTMVVRKEEAEKEALALENITVKDKGPRTYQAAHRRLESFVDGKRDSTKLELQASIAKE